MSVHHVQMEIISSGILGMRFTIDRHIVHVTILFYPVTNSLFASPERSERSEFKIEGPIKADNDDDDDDMIGWNGMDGSGNRNARVDQRCTME